MREIQLTQGKVALVDDEDYEKLNQHKWYAKKSCNTFYAARRLLTINHKQINIVMHHEVIGKPPKEFEVDHKDNNGCNNQKYNLRHVTKRQNHQNKQKKLEYSSKYPGVHWAKSRNKWQTQIQINGQHRHLGYFIDEVEAFNAYRQAVEGIGEEMIGAEGGM